VAGRRFSWVAAAVLALTLAVGSLPQGEATAASTPVAAESLLAEAPAVPGTKRVTIFGRRYTPSTIKVPLGTKHTVTGNTFRSRFGQLFDLSPNPLPGSQIPPAPFGALSSPVLDARPEPAYPGAPRPPELPSSLFEYTPSQEGSYSFRCTIHKNMGGLIVVGTPGQPGPGDPPPPPPPAPDPKPPPVQRPSVVTLFGNRFRPEKVQVVEGTEVIFRNGDRNAHRVSGTTYRDANGVLKDWEPVRDGTNPLPPSGLPPFTNVFSGRPTPIPGNQTRDEDQPYTYLFDAPGTYNYRGELGTMRGTIVVVTPTPVR
jgi:plastocyanin